MTMQLRPPRPASQHVSDRDNIILKSVMHELALALDEPLISTAHAAGTDRQALRLARELEARTLERAENQPSAELPWPASPAGLLNQDLTNDQFNHGPWGPPLAS